MLYQALIGYIWYELKDEPEKQNINTVVELINMMEVREDDEKFENVVDLLFKELQYGKGYVEDPDIRMVIEEGVNPQPEHFAVRQYSKFRLSAGAIGVFFIVFGFINLWIGNSNEDGATKNKAIIQVIIGVGLIAVAVLIGTVGLEFFQENRPF